ncbi:Hypothetical predicted protein [Scomber scombrus]|uniref:Uncharacterized protein n=1 Tax=Scomber scombrus TaxID=13677 RepID=A0AAV1QGZ5_SCOSC
MSDRLEALSGQEDRSLAGECESRAAPDHSEGLSVGQRKGVIKEAERLKLNPPPADRGNRLAATFTQKPEQLGSPQKHDG